MPKKSGKNSNKKQVEAQPSPTAHHAPAQHTPASPHHVHAHHTHAQATSKHHTQHPHHAHHAPTQHHEHITHMEPAHPHSTYLPHLISHQHAHKSAHAAREAYEAQLHMHQRPDGTGGGGRGGPGISGEGLVPQGGHDYAHHALNVKIMENYVHLQKVQTAMTEKFDRLANQITALLALFEGAARSFASNPANLVADKDSEFADKIDKILEQNKLLAKGLTLVEEKVRNQVVQVVGGGGGGLPQSTGPTRAMVHEIGTNPAVEKIPSALEKREEEGEYEPSINRPLPKF